MEGDGVFVVFDEWGGQIQQFFECGTGEDIFGRRSDDVTGVGEGNFIDNDDWCCLIGSDEADKFVGGGEDCASQVFETVEDCDAISRLPREDG